MASNLTDQVRNIAGVTTAVARGDLTTRITVDARGEILELKNTVNTMVDQLSSFAAEVTRVAREVGTEGRLGGQAEVKRHRRCGGRMLTRIPSTPLGGNSNESVSATSLKSQPLSPRAISRPASQWMRVAKFCSLKTPSTPWWISSAHSRPKSLAWRARWVRKEISADRRTCPVSAAPGKILRIR